MNIIKIRYGLFLSMIILFFDKSLSGQTLKRSGKYDCILESKIALELNCEKLVQHYNIAAQTNINCD